MSEPYRMTFGEWCLVVVTLPVLVPVALLSVARDAIEHHIDYRRFVKEQEQRRAQR